jgi:hypothetical protein
VQGFVGLAKYSEGTGLLVKGISEDWSIVVKAGIVAGFE